jgi:hypothetical protein
MTITVNGRTHDVKSRRMSYDQVVRMGGGDPSLVYTVVWSHRTRCGSLIRGQSIVVMPRMIFTSCITSAA